MGEDALVSDLLEKCWLLSADPSRHIIASVSDAFKGLITDIGQNRPKIPPLTHYHGEMAC